MIHDENLILQTPVTKTADFPSASINLKTGTPLARPLFGEVLYNSAANASGSNTLTFSIEHSDDNATFTTCATADPITLNTVAKHGQVTIPFISQKKYFRLNANFEGAGSGSTAAYQGFIGLSSV